MWHERSVRGRPFLPGIWSTKPRRIKGCGEPAGQAGSQRWWEARLSSLGRNAVDHTYAPGQARAGRPGQGRVGKGGNGKAKEGSKAAGCKNRPRARPQAHLKSVSSAPSCLSRGRPRAARRSLLSSSAARQYWACSSPPLGYVCWMNFTSGLARSTSEVFFNCTEMNVAMASTSVAVPAK